VDSVALSILEENVDAEDTYYGTSDCEAADDVSAVIALTRDLTKMNGKEYMSKLQALSDFDRQIVEILNSTNTICLKK
jgi:hypothetical protein